MSMELTAAHDCARGCLPVTAKLRAEMVIERHDGVDVVREDLCNEYLPSGKLRALIPWMCELKREGRYGEVVNHAVSYSNSHAIVSYTSTVTGLKATCFVCSARSTPQVDLAREYGGNVRLAGAMHLAPLKKITSEYCLENSGRLMLNWGLVNPQALRYISEFVLQSKGEMGYRSHSHHVVPVGAGGYIWAVATGLMGFHCGPYAIHGVCSSGSLATNYKRLNAIRPQRNIVLVDRTEQMETPFPSDPNYEWWAWPEALRLRDDGKSVIFWCVGRPLV